MGIPNRDGTRRVQMYGVRHDEQYQVHAKALVTPLPRFATRLVSKIHDFVSCHFPDHLGYMYQLGTDKLTELFVNEYDPSSSLQFHTDHKITFEEMIVGISV